MAIVMLIGRSSENRDAWPRGKPVSRVSNQRRHSCSDRGFVKPFQPLRTQFIQRHLRLNLTLKI